MVAYPETHGTLGFAKRNLEAHNKSMAKANARQVGGSHYKVEGQIQHWDIVAQHDLDYFQGQITKYVMRWKKKNGMQDLEKAQHFLEKYIEVERARAENNCGAEPAGRGYVCQD